MFALTTQKTEPINERPFLTKAYVKLKAIRQSIGNHKNPTTVFVTGKPRSGTNMLMIALDRTMLTTVVHETDPRAYTRYVLRDTEQLEKIRDTCSSPNLILKCLMEGERLTDLLDRFTPSRGIWLTRHFDSMILSHQRSFSGNREWLDQIVEDRTAGVWRARGMTDETHACLKDAYHPNLNTESAIGLIWWQRNRLAFDQLLPDRDDVGILDYDELTTDPQGIGRAIADKLALPYRSFMYKNIVQRKTRESLRANLEPHVRQMCYAMWARLKSSDIRTTSKTKLQ